MIKLKDILLEDRLNSPDWHESKKIMHELELEHVTYKRRGKDIDAVKKVLNRWVNLSNKASELFSYLGSSEKETLKFLRDRGMLKFVQLYEF